MSKPLFLIFVSVVVGIASRAFCTVQKCSTKELHPYARIKALKRIDIFGGGEVSHNSPGWPGFQYVVQVAHKLGHSCVGLLSTGIICMRHHLRSGLNIVFLSSMLFNRCVTDIGITRLAWNSLCRLDCP